MKWIAMEEEMAPFNEEVLVFMMIEGNKGMRIMKFYEDGACMIERGGLPLPGHSQLTHWMSLPEIPSKN
jgi:Protein of unknown function (DUF551)